MIPRSDSLWVPGSAARPVFSAGWNGFRDAVRPKASRWKLTLNRLGSGHRDRCSRSGSACARWRTGFGCSAGPRAVTAPVAGKWEMVPSKAMPR